LLISLKPQKLVIFQIEENSWNLLKYTKTRYSQTSIVRGGRGVPNFKKFSAYNRGPRSKEVCPILASNYSQSNWLWFWKSNHICRLSYASFTLPHIHKCSLTLGDPRSKKDAYLIAGCSCSKLMCSILTYGTFLNSHSILGLTIHLQYTLNLKSADRQELR
jgi:hypothetical protein